MKTIKKYLSKDILFENSFSESASIILYQLIFISLSRQRYFLSSMQSGLRIEHLSLIKNLYFYKQGEKKFMNTERKEIKIKSLFLF